MNKLHFGKIQPNGKEHKLWLTPDGKLNVYNESEQHWDDIK